MIIGCILAVCLLVACGITYGLGGFAGLSFLWQIPALTLGLAAAAGLAMFLFLWVCCAGVKMTDPQDSYSNFFGRLAHFYSKVICEVLLMKLEPRGFDRELPEGRFLLVCNHLEQLDPVLMHVYFPGRQLAFISKKENDSMFLVNKIMRRTMCLPIDRENDRAALRTILTAIQRLKADQVTLCVFPEGYCSDDGNLQQMRNGVFKIALKAQVPIVVCTVQNTQKVFHNALRLRPTRIPVHLLGVLPAEQIREMSTIEIGDLVYRMMAEDLGEL